jgi:hypothetical protein
LTRLLRSRHGRPRADFSWPRSLLNTVIPVASSSARRSCSADLHILMSVSARAHVTRHPRAARCTGWYAIYGNGRRNLGASPGCRGYTGAPEIKKPGGGARLVLTRLTIRFNGDNAVAPMAPRDVPARYRSSGTTGAHNLRTNRGSSATRGRLRHRYPVR